MGSLYALMLTFLQERECFLWEYGDLTYGIVPYFLAKTVVEIPWMFLFPVLFSACIYFVVGYVASFTNFLFFAFVNCLVVIVASSYGMFLGSVFSNPVPISASLMMPIMLFGGYYVNAGSYWDWIGWLQYLSPVRYAMEAIAANEFGD